MRAARDLASGNYWPVLYNTELGPDPEVTRIVENDGTPTAYGRQLLAQPTATLSDASGGYCSSGQVARFPDGDEGRDACAAEATDAAGTIGPVALSEGARAVGAEGACERLPQGATVDALAPWLTRGATLAGFFDGDEWSSWSREQIQTALEQVGPATNAAEGMDAWVWRDGPGRPQRGGWLGLEQAPRAARPAEGETFCWCCRSDSLAEARSLSERLLVNKRGPERAQGRLFGGQGKLDVIASAFPGAGRAPFDCIMESLPPSFLRLSLGAAIGAETWWQAQAERYTTDTYQDDFGHQNFVFHRAMRSMPEEDECFCTATCQNCADAVYEDYPVNLYRLAPDCDPSQVQGAFSMLCGDVGCAFATGTTCLEL